MPLTGVMLLLGGGMTRASAPERIAAVAVFPVENLSAGPIPADEVRQFLVDQFGSKGVRVLGEADLDAFMARHRVRYEGGIDAATAESLRQETDVDAVAIATVERASSAAPPKVALFVRLVSIKAVPSVIWAGDAGISGDDAPGFFDLGVTNAYPALLKRALDRIGSRLTAFLKTGQAGTDEPCASKFRPKSFHRDLVLESDRPYSVAVVPFFNLSDRRNAGEILALLFTRHLSALQSFRVIDTGVTRSRLLDARIIMDAGLSLSDADMLASLVEADFVLTGRVIRYDDYDGTDGRTGVEFSSVLIEKKSRRVVWSSNSYNEGADGAGPFGRGTSRSAHAMATQMVRLTTELMAGHGH